jgi:glycerophosphoryl diester phosphodiesterase
VEEDSVYTNREILYFVMLNNIFAVTLPESKIESDYYDVLLLEDKKVYAYNVNDAKKKKSLEEIGVSGFYTDEMDKLIE